MRLKTLWIQYDRVRQTNAALGKWIDVIKSKEEAKQKQCEAEQQAIKDAEMRKRTKQNLNWIP